MASRIRIPWLLDLVAVSAPGEAREAAANPALDRAFAAPKGPLLNRLLARRLDGALRAGGAPLPSALPRGDPGRIRASAALAERLDPARAPWDEPSLAAIAARLRGAPGRPLGELVQEAVGRLFTPGYRADSETWRAALTLDGALRSNNPLRRLWWALTGAVGAAQARLAAAVGGDAAGVHATGVAVHTFLASVERLGEALSDRGLTRRLTDRAARARALLGPETAIRSASEDTRIGGAEAAEGALVLLRLAEASRIGADPRVAFLSESWSGCPAARLVPAMLDRIWALATRAPD